MTITNADIILALECLLIGFGLLACGFYIGVTESKKVIRYFVFKGLVEYTDKLIKDKILDLNSIVIPERKPGETDMFNFRRILDVLDVDVVKTKSKKKI